jgi:hypothetical protein
MHLRTKRITVIEMSEDEHRAFLECVAEAGKAHEVRYAEQQLENGAFLGVHVRKWGEDSSYQQTRKR